jgi:DNA-binding transcriptional MerR regulator
MDERQETRYGLAELAEAAGVSIRTVRYYIAEGLLPPPEGAGPRSAYTPGHLDRLRLIGRLKDAYLPLREIRRRLDGLDGAAVRDLLSRLGSGTGVRRRGAGDEGTEPAATGSTPPDSAADYLARVMDHRPDESAGIDYPTASPPEPIESTLAGETAPFERAPLLDLDLDPALALAPPAATEVTTDGPWRRIVLGPDAELLVRETAFQRRRDRVEWLVGWAKKVFKA